MDVRKANILRQRKDLHDGKGCEVNPVYLGCLRCPLDACLYDDPGAVLRTKKQVKDLAMIAEMVNERLTWAATAERFDVTIRTVARVLRRVRDEFPNHVSGLERGRHDPGSCGCGAVFGVQALIGGGEAG